jgi:hypothetical protein
MSERAGVLGQPLIYIKNCSVAIFSTLFAPGYEAGIVTQYCNIDRLIALAIAIDANQKVQFLLYSNSIKPSTVKFKSS